MKFFNIIIIIDKLKLVKYLANLKNFQKEVLFIATNIIFVVIILLEFRYFFFKENVELRRVKFLTLSAFTDTSCFSEGISKAVGYFHEARRNCLLLSTKKILRKFCAVDSIVLSIRLKRI